MKSTVTKQDSVSNKIPIEDFESESFASWLRLSRYDFTHIGNESGQRGTVNIIRMMTKKKRLGVSKGFPDFIVVLKKGSLLFIEMKRSKKSLSKVSKEQEEWIEKLSEIRNVEAKIAYGWQEAIQIVLSLEKL